MKKISIEVEDQKKNQIKVVFPREFFRGYWDQRAEVGCIKEFYKISADSEAQFVSAICVDRETEMCIRFSTPEQMEDFRQNLMKICLEYLTSAA